MNRLTVKRLTACLGKLRRCPLRTGRMMAGARTRRQVWRDAESTELSRVSRKREAGRCRRLPPDRGLLRSTSVSGSASRCAGPRSRSAPTSRRDADGDGDARAARDFSTSPLARRPSCEFQLDACRTGSATCASAEHRPHRRSFVRVRTHAHRLIATSSAGVGNGVPTPAVKPFTVNRSPDVTSRALTPRYDSSARARDTCRSRDSAFSLICRTRSRVIPSRLPICSSVIGSSPSSPK